MKSSMSFEQSLNYNNTQDTYITKEKHPSVGSTEMLDEQESSNLEESSLSPSPNRKEPRSPGLLRNWDFKKNFNSLPRPGLKKKS